MNNGWLEEAYVDQGRFVWDKPSTTRLVAYLDRIGVELPDDDYETEINLAMADWFQMAFRALTRGFVVLIDYGRPAHEYYASERNRGTLRAFREHQLSDRLLSAPGRQDLTADVDFTSAALDAQNAGFQPLAYMELGSFLMEGARHFKAAPKGLRYLLHPEGMGSAFHVLILGKNLSWTPADFPNNRLKRLGLERNICCK
jgi:SAM-dependent MidA family methyltransferase